MKYSKELKEKILSEVKESTNISAVAKKHNIPDTTIHTWIKKQMNLQPTSELQDELKRTKKEISELKLKNMILEDLLKKTHNLWASD
jgi:transposase-like protein